MTVVPVAALPWLGLAGGVYLAVTPGALGYGIGMLVASLVIAPFAWRILGPVASRFLGPPPQARLDKPVEELESIRADLTHTQAAELERIERGLHGAQARLVALGMSMGAAEHLVDADPEAAKAILAEARLVGGRAHRTAVAGPRHQSAGAIRARPGRRGPGRWRSTLPWRSPCAAP